MAKPRIFISSTFYDLRQIRMELENFINQYGFEAVLTERGKIPFDKSDELEDACYREINFCDMLIAIIGGKFGTQSKYVPYSISQKEIESSLKSGKQVFVFIEKNVYAEYSTFQKNKENNSVSYCYVDDVRIYNFIESIDSLPKSNPIFSFETSQDITSILKEQWAGFFYRYLQEDTKRKEFLTLKDIESTARTLNQLVTFLTEERKDKDQAIKDILLSNHPAMEQMRKSLRIRPRIFFSNKSEMNDILVAWGYKNEHEEFWDNPEYDEWFKKGERQQYVFKIYLGIFDEEGRLKIFTKKDWKEEYIKLEVSDMEIDLEDDPFQ